MAALISIGDVVLFVGGFVLAWIFKDKIKAFVAGVVAKVKALV